MTIAHEMLIPYNQSLFALRRRATRVVMVGDLGVGGDHPIRVQSMTTTRTHDTEATVAQAIRLVEAGCEIVRITAPTVNDARNLGVIRRALRSQGIMVPLVADIHFSPAAALEAALHVEKVRINPGNYADSKTFAVRDYSDEQYFAELSRIEERFKPVVLRCKERGVALRIGTNHGSLSDRIMNRFGDTPLGMVESAIEFLLICEKYEYHDVIFSMKSSNPKVMIQAYRLLAARLDAMNKPYPLHLGVTEAGDGEDGRIKSAIGIGSLLDDGLGDTIRVSLTEDPEAEIPVAFALGQRYGQGFGETSIARPIERLPWNPYEFTRRAAMPIQVDESTIGGSETPRVIVSIPGKLADDHSPITIARRLLVPMSRTQPSADTLGVWIEDQSDVLALRSLRQGLIRSAIEAPILARLRPTGADDVGTLARGVELDASIIGVEPHAVAAVLSATTEFAVPRLVIEGLISAADDYALDRVNSDTDPRIASVVTAMIDGTDRAVAAGRQVILALRCESPTDLIHANRSMLVHLAESPIDAVRGAPILLVAPDRGLPATSLDGLLDASIGLGSLLCDGFGDAAEIPTIGDPTHALRLTFNVLQAAGARISKTDYVACPSCGRTLFDLQSTTARIKERTNHLVGIKIAIMGCVVNGPGEMADADFGYVGGAPGEVNLYVGKECVERGVPEAEADLRLVDLIKQRGRWVDPE